MKVIRKGEKAPYSGILYSKVESDKLKKDSLILDEIENIFKENNGKFFIDKNT